MEPKPPPTQLQNLDEGRKDLQQQKKENKEKKQKKEKEVNKK